MKEFRETRALVTGGGSGIGQALALELGARGAEVMVSDIRSETANATVDAVRSAGGTAFAFPCDISDRGAVQAMQRDIAQTRGAVSLLFANAGVTFCGRMAELSDKTVDWVNSVNFLGVQHCLRAFLPAMIEARHGHVVATSSVAALTPAMLPYYAPYTGAKAGVIGLMLNLREELAEHGVGCSVLCPAGVATNMVESLKARPTRFGGRSDELIVHSGRPGAQPEAIQFREPAEVARMVIEGVARNRPIITTDAGLRAAFVRGFVEPVMAAFDDVLAFDSRTKAAER